MDKPSQHDNHHEDRMWEFGCKNTFDSGADCFWSPYVNDFDQKFNYECPPHHIIAGMSSYHSNKHEDRRWALILMFCVRSLELMSIILMFCFCFLHSWQFYCCRSNGHCTASCEWTTYVNWFDELFHWTVPNQNYLVGAESYHENKHE